MIVDTHAHYDDEAFDEDRELLLNGMTEAGIPFIVNIGASINSTKQTIELTKQYPFIYGAVGIHPSDTAELEEASFAWLKQVAEFPKIVAIGEIGLDYYWDTPDKQIQKTWFDRQMELAKEIKLPAVIHSRDAAKDTLDMIKAAKLEEIGGVIHCFSYSKEMAKSYLDMGFYLGIGGVLTFKNAHKLKEVVEYSPLDQLVLETDCPYLSPEPNRGKRNTSLNLVYVAQEIAKIKNIDYDRVLEVTEQNARKLYTIAE